MLHNLEYKRRQYRYGVHVREEVDTLTPYKREHSPAEAPLDPQGVLHFGAQMAVEIAQFMVFGAPKDSTSSLDKSDLFEDAPVVLFGKRYMNNKVFRLLWKYLCEQGMNTRAWRGMVMSWNGRPIAAASTHCEGGLQDLLL